MAEHNNAASTKVNFVNIPQELKSDASFCTWKYIKRRGQKKPTKMPFIAGTDKLASTSDPSTFRDFPSAMRAYALGDYDGIGIRHSLSRGA